MSTIFFTYLNSIWQSKTKLYENQFYKYQAHPSELIHFALYLTFAFSCLFTPAPAILLSHEKMLGKLFADDSVLSIGHVKF